ncbi:MAG: hypothetical protein IT291_05125 [Deltaproteobacteria bacterium]|nr:hypothetical protein [Deltaproteobacteria bacterium]
MLNLTNKNSAAKGAASWSSQKNDIEVCHRKLLQCLEMVQVLVDRAQTCESRVCLLVLEEDLDSLLNEAEDHLFLDKDVEHFSFLSFVSRSDTVIKEAVSIISTSNCA